MRNLRGIRYWCPFCESKIIIKKGFDDKERFRPLWCKNCNRRFDDLTETIFSGHHQPLTVWILCIYFMGLNLSNSQIAKELELDSSDVHQMTTKLRKELWKKNPVKLDGEVEFDEIYIIAGHKGNPEIVKEEKREGRGTDWR